MIPETLWGAIPVITRSQLQKISLSLSRQGETWRLLDQTEIRLSAALPPQTPVS